MSARRNDELNPLDSTGLCLLSLDGGGVRGLSTLYILKSVMNRLNNERKTARLPPVKPCEVFDLIGGTSTGGLIAIMLGRLEMDVDECIIAYAKLAEAVFSQKKSRLPFNLKGKVKAQFDSLKLEKAIRDTIKGSGISETDLFNEGTKRGCRTFVCTVDQNTKSIVHLRSYTLSDESSNIPASICQAALATSAATTFFEPVQIGNRKFADGGLGANNPVDEVEGEAANIWCSESGDLKPLVKCFLSIGTGNPGIKAFEESFVKFLGQTVVGIATETEETEKRFIAKWRKHYDENRYFRFNVDQGLQSIGLDEYKQQGAMESATERYLVNQAQKNRVRDCIKNLELKQNKTEASFAVSIEEYKILSLQQKIVMPRIKWIVPFERNSCFTGRESELTRLEEQLYTEGGPKKIAVIGLGGVGKMSLIVELAYRIRKDHEDCSVFWIPATNFESLQQAYLNICQQLRLSGWDNKNEDPKRLLQHYLSQDSAGQWLLVFDNADDISMWTGNQVSDRVSHRLIDYLPTSQVGRIVFTSRDRKTAYNLVQRSELIVKVPELSKDVATQLLQKYVPGLDLATHEDDVESLLKLLTYLPLAIVQAASYINQNDESLATYISLLADQEDEVLDLLSEHFEDDSRYREAKNPIAMTWLISFEQIRVRDPLAAELLSFIACLDSKDVPLSLLPPGLSRKEEINALGTLDAYAFVYKRQADSSLDVHRLVHLATRGWLRREGLLSSWTGRVMARLAEVLADASHDNRVVWRPYMPHAYYVLRSCPGSEDDGNKLNLLWRYGICLYHDGRYNEAEVPFQRVLETHKTKLEADHPETLNNMVYLASTFFHQGRWDEAEKMELLVMQISKIRLGVDHLDTLTSICNLATTYRNQGRWDEAEKLEVTVMEIRKIKLGTDHLHTVTSMDNLAMTYGCQGRWNKAEKLQVSAMKTYKSKLGADHPDTLTSMGNLALTYANQRRWYEAEKLQVYVMETSKTRLGANHPDTLLSMGNLAATYRNQHLLDKAEKLFVQVVEVRKSRLGADHPDTLASMGNLASTYVNQRRWDEAEKLEWEVMQISKARLGEDHPDTLRSISNLATTYGNQRRWSTAETLLVQVIQARKTKLGADHPDTLTSMDNLASMYVNQHRWDEAEKLFVRVIETRKIVLSADHPDTVTSMYNLANTYGNQRRWDEVEKLLVQVLEARKARLGADHLGTLMSMNHLALTWSYQGRHANALALMKDCVEARRRILGPEHPDTLSSAALVEEWS